MHLIILASGRGSRLGNLTSNLPKCLVKINDRCIIDYQRSIFKYFKKVIIVVGYKSNLIKKHFINNYKIFFIENKKYRSTDMVFSLSLAKKYFNSNVIVTYSDIIFNPRIIKYLLNSKSNMIPVYKNWYDLWSKRMSIKKIKMDAEDLIIKNNNIVSIGGKINYMPPKFQYMGIIYFTQKSMIKFNAFFTKYSNKNISMTEMLNLLIKEKILNFKAYKNSNYWFEIDNLKDYKITKKIIKDYVSL